MIEVFRYKTLLLILSIASAVLTVDIGIEGLRLVFLLPLTYGFCFRYILPNNLKLHAGLLILFLVLSFRYLLYPILLANSNPQIPYVYQYGNRAVYYMLLEMIIIFMTIAYVYRNVEVETKRIELKPINNSIVVLLFGASLLFAITGNDFMAGKHFIWETESINQVLVKKNSGVASQIFSWTQAYMIIFLVCKFALKYFTWYKGRYFFLAIVCCFIPCIVYSGHSRLSLLIPLVCSCAFAFKVFGSKSKYSIFTALGLGLIILVALSIVKNLKNVDDAGVSDLFSASLINSYFEGFENIVLGLRTYDKVGVQPTWFVWDSLANAMGISHYFESMPGTSKAFNELIYGKVGLAYDQIVPTITSGMIYFSHCFFFIPTVIMTYVVCKCDIAFAKTSSLEKAYLYSNFPVIVAWAVPGSWQHLTTRFFNFYIPILLLIFLNNRLSRK